MNNLRLLVPHNDLWKSVKINNDGTEDNEIPIALLVERIVQGNNTRYNRIDLVKILDVAGNPNTILNQGLVTEYTAQIEVWTGN